MFNMFVFVKCNLIIVIFFNRRITSQIHCVKSVWFQSVEVYCVHIIRMVTSPPYFEPGKPCLLQFVLLHSIGTSVFNFPELQFNGIIIF